MKPDRIWNIEGSVGGHSYDFWVRAASLDVAARKGKRLIRAAAKEYGREGTLRVEHVEFIGTVDG